MHEQLISLEAKLDDVFEFFKPVGQSDPNDPRNQKKKGSLLGKAAKVGTVGGGLYGASLLARGEQFKGGTLNPGKPKPALGTTGPLGGKAPTPAPAATPSPTVGGKVDSMVNKAKGVPGRIKQTGGFSAMGKRAGGVFKKDKKLVSGFVGGLGKRLLGR
jgi:hypothetical protein